MDTQLCPGAMISHFTKEQVIGFPDAVKRQLVYGSIAEPEGNFDCALVLGGPIEFMESRAKAAADLYHAGRVPYLMVTGGVCRETSFGYLSEAQILSRYLESFGVPSDRIILEEQATTTVNNMTFCQELLQQHFSDRTLRLVIVTSMFHVRRSMALAKHFLPCHQIQGKGAIYPKDNAAEYLTDPELPKWVTGECRCLWSHVNAGSVQDFPVL